MNPYADLTDEQLIAQCRVETLRGSGPGGQHRNKVETAVIITHEPSGLRAEASERRSQEKNRAEAVRRLRVKLAIDSSIFSQFFPLFSLLSMISKLPSFSTRGAQY